MARNGSEPEESTALVVRHEVVPDRPYDEYRQDLRRDFWFSCCYCWITEVEAQGIDFEIDHYLPQRFHRDLENVYTNLMYSCSVCNRRKWHYDPDDEDRENGLVVIRPDEMDPRDHLRLEGVRLEGLTNTGEFNIDRLDLNRYALRKIREFRERIADSAGYIAFGISELAHLNLDQLPRQYRGLLLQMQAQARKYQKESSQSMAEFVEDLARSPLLDPDPDVAAKTKRLRAFHKEQRSVGVPAPVDSPEKLGKKGKKRKA